MENKCLGSCPFCGSPTVKHFNAVLNVPTKRVYELEPGDVFKLFGVFVIVRKVTDTKIFYKYQPELTTTGGDKNYFIGAKGQQKVEIFPQVVNNHVKSEQ